MTIGFIDNNGIQRTPDNGVTKTVGPITKVTTFADGYEQRYSLGVNNLEEKYSVAFTNRSSEEIQAIINFLDLKKRVGAFTFTIPDDNEVGGELDILVVAEPYSVQYFNEEVYSLTCEFVRVYEQQNPEYLFTDGFGSVIESIEVFEGDTLTLPISTENVADGTTLFFVLNNPDGSQAIRVSVNTASNTVSSGDTTTSITANGGTEEALYYQLQIRTGSAAGPVVKELEIKWKGTFTGSVVQFTNASFSPVTSIVMNEGATQDIYVEGTNTPPATYYWELASATTADFLAISGSVATSGTTVSNSGFFTIATVADLTTEGTENYTLRLRSGSLGGPILDTLNVQVNDTSTLPATVDIAESSVNLVTNSSATLNVDSTNVAGSEAYWKINSGFGKFSADQGSVSLASVAGSPLRKTGSFNIISTDDSTSTAYTLEISENQSISPVRDTVSINTGSARFTDGSGNDISAVVFGSENGTAVVNVEAAGIDPASPDLYWTLEPGNAVYYSRFNPDTVDWDRETITGATWTSGYNSGANSMDDTYYFYGANTGTNIEIYCVDHSAAPGSSPTYVATVFSENPTSEGTPFPAEQGIKNIQHSGNTLLTTLGTVSKLYKVTTTNGLWTDAVTVEYGLPDKPEGVYWDGGRYAIIALLDRTCKLWDTQTNSIVDSVQDTDVVDLTQTGRVNYTDTYFGHHVSISGDYAAIGTRFDPDTSTLYQDVCMFNISSGSFVYISTIDNVNLYGPGSQGSPIAPAASANRDDFGLYFLLDGDYIYVTAGAEEDATSPGLYITPLLHCIRTQNNWVTSSRIWSQGPQGIVATNKTFYASYLTGRGGDSGGGYPLLQVSQGVLWVTASGDTTVYPLDALSGYLLSDTSDSRIDVATTNINSIPQLAVSSNKVITEDGGSAATLSAPTVSVLNPTLSEFSALTGTVSLSGTTTASSGTFTVTSLPDGVTETPFAGYSLFYNLYLRSGSVTGNILDVITLEIPDDSIGPEDALFVTTNNTTRQVYDSVTLTEGSSFNFYIEKRNIATGNLTWLISPQDASLFVDDENTVGYSGGLTGPAGSRFPSWNNTQQTITTNSGVISENTSFRLRVCNDLIGDISNLISAIDLTVVVPTAEFVDDEDTAILETFMTEGATETINVKTQYITDTTLYWTLESATTADFVAVSGSFALTIVDEIGTGTFDIQALADSTTENQESYTLNLRETSTSGTILDTITLYVDDTSQGAVKYQFVDVTVSPNTTLTTLNIDESNSSYLIGIQTEQVAAGTTIYWTIEDSSIFEFVSTSGSVVTVGTLTEALATFSITTKADLLTEGAQTKRLYIRLGSETGTPLNVLFLNISDTSTSAALPPGQYHTISSTDYVNIDNPFGNSSSSFGKGIDFKSGRLAVSAPGASLSPSGEGAVSLYTYYNTASPLAASSPDKIYADVTLKNPTGLSADTFGNTLHFSRKANKLAVTAPGESSNVGALYVYDLESSPITFDTFAPESSAYSFGTASAYSDYSERLVVTFETGSTVPGGAYIYSLPDDTTPSELLSITGLSQDDGFGSSVAIYNTTIAIGAPNATVSAQINQGKVYLYSIAGDLLDTIDGPVVQPANFGESVALYLNKLAVFAKTDGAVADVGSVYIYDITDSPATLTETITIPSGFSPNTNRFFGQTLELNGNQLFISFYNGYEGACLEYDLAASQFVNLFENKLPAPTSSDQFYQTLAYRPPFLFAGHPGSDSTFSSPGITVTDVGAVQAYKTTDEEVDFTSTSQYYLTIPSSPGQTLTNTSFGNQAIANDKWYVTRSNQTSTPIYLVYDTSTSPFSFVGSFQGCGQATQWMDLKGDLFAVVECLFLPASSTVRRLDIYNLATLTNIYQIDDDQAGTSPINDGISKFAGGIVLGNNRFWHLSENLATPKRIFERDSNGVLVSTIEWNLDPASLGNNLNYSITANDRYLFAYISSNFEEQLTVWRIGEYDFPWADITNFTLIGNSAKIQVYKNYLIFNPAGFNLGDNNGIVWTSDSGTWRDLRPYVESRNIQSQNTTAGNNRPPNDPTLLGRYFPTKEDGADVNARLYDVFTNKIVRSYSDTAQSTTQGRFSAINSTHIIWAYPNYDYTAGFPNTKGAISVHRINPAEEALVYTVNTFLSDQTAEGSWRFYVNFTDGGNPINVDWGDGTSSTPSSASYATHTYAIPGVYKVKVTGSGQIRANQSLTGDGDDKVLSIDNWGSAYVPLGAYSMFRGYTRLEYVNSYGNVDWSGATQIPEMFKGCTSLRHVKNSWNLNGITQTFGMFEGCSSFTGIGIEEWDMSTVVSLNAMFKDCTSFSADLSSWNTSSAGQFVSLFENCSMDFSVATWTNNIQSANSLTSMFKNAKKFNSSLFTTLPAAETSLASFLEGASSFNDSSIISFNTAGITNYSSMFKEAYSFNQPIGTWTTDSATNMNNMFQDAISFDQDLTAWNVALIPSEPTDFSTGAPLQNANKPNWGVSPSVGLGIDVDTTLSGFGSGTSQFKVQVSSANPTGSDPITIDWGDGNSDTPTGDITHTYSAAGTYKIDITGTGAVSLGEDRNKITGIKFDSQFLPTTFNSFLYSSSATGSSTVTQITGTMNLTQWGTGETSSLGSLNNAFRGNTSLQGFQNAWSVPSNIETLGNAFTDCSALTATNCTIDTSGNSSGVNAFNMFQNCTNFDEDISGWNMNNLANASLMFANCSSYDNGGQDLTWTFTGQLINSMSQMFRDCSSFVGRGLPNWVIIRASGTLFFGAMFQNCTLLDQDFSSWGLTAGQNFRDGSTGSNFNSTFGNCVNLNFSINGWDFSGSQYTLGTMFSGCSSWNNGFAAGVNNNCTLSYQPSTFGVAAMFLGCSSMNCNWTGTWITTAMARTFRMFEGCTSFNGTFPAGWNMSSVTETYSMFQDCTDFDQDISGWDMSSVTRCNDMFNNADAFDRDISGWNVNAVTNATDFSLNAEQKTLGNWTSAEHPSNGTLGNFSTT